MGLFSESGRFTLRTGTTKQRAGQLPLKAPWIVISPITLPFLNSFERPHR